jgi:hypothetical protein
MQFSIADVKLLSAVLTNLMRQFAFSAFVAFYKLGKYGLAFSVL